MPKFIWSLCLVNANKKLIARWDSKRELFYDDIVQLQNMKVSNEEEVCKNSKIRLAAKFENNNE